MDPVVFGLHTAEVKHLITRREANTIKAQFGLSPDEPLKDVMNFYPEGITKFEIVEVAGRKPRFYAKAKINFARAIDYSDVLIMPFTSTNVKKAIAAFNKTLKLLPLSAENADFSTWTVNRFDSTFDIWEENKNLFIKLLNRSLDLSNGRKRCERIPIITKTSEELLCQSVYFGNDSFRYNGYDKAQEQADKGKTPTEDIDGLFRMERQNLEAAIKKLLPTGRVGDLADAKTRELILRTMIDEIGLFFGKGDFYSICEVKNRFLPNNVEDFKTVWDAIMQINKSYTDHESDSYKKASYTLARFGIAPCGIPMGVELTYMMGLYNRIVSQYPRPQEKRQYNSFPVPHVGADGRYRANITLYRGYDKNQKSIVGKTLEEYESNVLKELESTCHNNTSVPPPYDPIWGTSIIKSFDSLCRFRKVVKTRTVKSKLDKIIEHYRIKLPFNRRIDDD